MVFNFTFRDSKEDFINISSWGTENYITEINNSLNIGSVIQIKNVKISHVEKLSDAQKWKPWTSVNYELTLNEGSTEISLLNSTDFSELERLLNEPIKRENDYYTLEDVILNDRDLSGEFVNLLFSVKQVNFFF